MHAQQTVQAGRFFDNWSFGLVGGGMMPTTGADFPKDVRAVYGAELTKQITPVFGLGFEYVATNNVTHSRNIFDAHNLSILGRINFVNLFGGYIGKPRIFDMEAVVGAGWAHEYYNGETDKNFLTAKYGLNFNFNLGEKRAWTVALKPAIVYNLTAPEKSFPTYHVNYSTIEVMAGVTYHFKNRNNGEHYMTFHRGYDQAEVDGLNAKINDLRQSLREHETEIARQKRENEVLQSSNETLQKELADCLNRGPVVEKQTVTKRSASLEQTVTFRQGKHTVDLSQQPNVERVATFLRNHPEATVSIKGYASPEGSAEINARIALARAEAVKQILINKYGIAADRIQAEGQGVGNMFSEPDWNRVSICTINEAE